MASQRVRRRRARGPPTTEMLSQRDPPHRGIGGPWLLIVSMAAAGSTLVGGFGCSSTTAPDQTPTLLVSNATCTAGSCKDLYLRAVIWGWSIPQPPTGIKLLGFVHGPSTCLRFPPEWTLWVVSGSESTQLIWRPDDPKGILLFAFDSAIGYGNPTSAEIDSSNQGLWPYDGAALGSVGKSPTFVPASSPGWEIAFPPKAANGTATLSLTRAAPCVP
jgi:hypothetical protein